MNRHEGKTATIRARKEVELRAERDRLKRIISSLGVGLCIVGPDYKVYFQNDLLLHRFGDLKGKLCYKGYMGLSEPCESCPMVKAIESNSTQSAEVVAADGKLYKIVANPFIDTDGEIRSVEIATDITERKQAEEALKDHIKRVEALYAIAQTVSRSPNLERLLDSAVEKIREVMEADTAVISCLDEAAGELVMKAHRGLSQEFIAKIGRMKLEPDELERLMELRQRVAPPPENILSQRNLERLMAAAFKEGLQSNLAVQLLAKDFFLGSVSVSRRHPREFTKEDMDLLTAIARQIAMGIRNVYLLAR